MPVIYQTPEPKKVVNGKAKKQVKKRKQSDRGQGRKTLLDDKLFREIKDLVVKGLNLREIADELEMSYATMRDWEYENYQGFSDRMLTFKHERMIANAEDNIEVLQKSKSEKIKLDANTFILETLGKDKGFSKRTEHTGKNGRLLNLSEEEQQVIDEAFKKR